MSTAITHVQPGSIAQRLGLAAGDKLVSIAGEPIIDQIDYQALTAQERFDMMVEDAGGQTRTVHVRKEDWEPLGLTLASKYSSTFLQKIHPAFVHGQERLVQAAEGFQAQGIRHAVVRFGDTAGDGRQGIAVAAKGDRQTQSMLKIRTFQKGDDGFRHRFLTAFHMVV